MSQQRTEVIAAKVQGLECGDKRGESELLFYSSRRSDYLVAISLLGRSKRYDVRVALSPNRALPTPLPSFLKDDFKILVPSASSQFIPYVMTHVRSHG